MPLASLAQLDHSHRRHDEVIEGLVAAARRLAAGRPDAGDVDLVHGAIAYFQRSVTRHFLDEEGSVFPRLSTRRPELAEALAALSAEHPTQIALQNALAQSADQLDGESRPGAGKQLLELAERLAAQHKAHVAREDELFKAAQEALTSEDDAEITSEMAKRRDRDDDSGPHRAHGGRGGGGGGGKGKGMGMGMGKGEVKLAAASAAKTARTKKQVPAREPKAKAKPARKRR
ncbi:MAG TPA: hemerythrin domain-containing protein [Kofleriaceae bacterium]|nr:hemerythrin domain-containing protein [Kofleriaceae bacterium]